MHNLLKYSIFNKIFKDRVNNILRLHRIVNNNVI
jgi:hypothetical protein